MHVNAQRMTMRQVGNLAAIYYVLETAFVRYCGGSREGNHHCLRREDAEFSYETLVSALESRRYRSLGTDNIRYASMNLRALSRYGSVEFRFPIFSTGTVDLRQGPRSGMPRLLSCALYSKRTGYEIEAWKRAFIPFASK